MRWITIAGIDQNKPVGVQSLSHPMGFQIAVGVIKSITYAPEKVRSQSRSLRHRPLILVSVSRKLSQPAGTRGFFAAIPTLPHHLATRFGPFRARLRRRSLDIVKQGEFGDNRDFSLIQASIRPISAENGRCFARRRAISMACWSKIHFPVFGDNRVVPAP